MIGQRAALGRNRCHTPPDGFSRRYQLQCTTLIPTSRADEDGGRVHLPPKILQMSPLFRVLSNGRISTGFQHFSRAKQRRAVIWPRTAKDKLVGVVPCLGCLPGGFIAEGDGLGHQFGHVGQLAAQLVGCGFGQMAAVFAQLDGAQI